MTTTTNPLTGLAGDWTDFNRMERDDRFLGFGYIGGISASQAADRLEAVDELVHSAAAAEQLTYEDLFLWANSKHGRWFADVMFNGSPFEVTAAEIASVVKDGTFPTAALVTYLRTLEA